MASARAARISRPTRRWNDQVNYVNHVNHVNNEGTIKSGSKRGIDGGVGQLVSRLTQSGGRMASSRCRSRQRSVSECLWAVVSGLRSDGVVALAVVLALSLHSLTTSALVGLALTLALLECWRSLLSVFAFAVTLLLAIIMSYCGCSQSTVLAGLVDSLFSRVVWLVWFGMVWRVPRPLLRSDLLPYHCHSHCHRHYTTAIAIAIALIAAIVCTERQSHRIDRTHRTDRTHRMLVSTTIHHCTKSVTKDL